MRRTNQFCLSLCIAITLIISMINMPVFSEDNLKYESILSELKQSINLKDKEKTSNAISTLKQLKSEIPLSLVLTEIKYKKGDVSYRRLLADFTTYKIRWTGKDGFVNNVPLLKEIIEDKNEQTAIRRNSILALTKGFILNELKKEKENYTIDIISLLTNIVNDKKENPKVVAQAIHSLSRLKNNSIDDKLINIIGNWEVENPFKVKSASESLGRSKEEGAIPIFINIINFTDNIDIFVTAVYSIGLMETADMIEPLLTNYDRFSTLGRSACRGALRKNRKLLMAIITKDKPGPIIPSVIALAKIKEKSALPYLNSLLNDTTLDKNSILNAIKKIESE